MKASESVIPVSDLCLNSNGMSQMKVFAALPCQQAILYLLAD